jgi:O-antigen/teichoic acid export membrane protein
LARNQWVLADQALVSGMNFATTAILARMLGVYNFGIFSVLYIGLQYLNSLQLALVVQPMMSLAPQLRNETERRSFLRGMSGYQYFFSSCCCLLTVIGGSLEALGLIPGHLGGNLVIPFTLTVFGFQLQDYFRRICYVKDRGKTVFFNDVLSYGGQVAVFGALWLLGKANIHAAYYAIAATSLAAFIVGVFSDDLSTSRHEARIAVSRTWKAGRDLLVASQFQWLGTAGIYLVIAAITTVRAASGIRAAIALMGPVNVLYQLLDNVIPVRAARIYAKVGERGLVEYLNRACTLLSVVVGVPLLLVSIFARPVMTLAFGHAYSVFAQLVAWEAAYMWLGLIFRCLQYYHRTLNTMAVLARSMVVVSLVSLGACLVLSRRYGAVGGMAALVMGQTLNVSIPLLSAFRKHRAMRAAA